MKLIKTIFFHKTNYRVFFSFLIFAWCAGFSIIQFFPYENILGLLYPFLKYNYSIVCHQHTEKSFLLNGLHLFVCARCTGLYSGALAVSLIFIFVKKVPQISFKIALFSLVPVLVDIILYNSGAYNYYKITAFITGIFPGSVLFIYILSSFENFFKEFYIINEQK